MPAHHICLVSCFIHRVGGRRLRRRCNRAGMIFVNIFLYSWCSTKICQHFCHQLTTPFAAKKFLTPSLSPCAMYTQRLFVTEGVCNLFCPKKLPSNFDTSAAAKMWLLNFRLNFCHAKLPPPLPPKYGLVATIFAVTFCHQTCHQLFIATETATHIAISNCHRHRTCHLKPPRTSGIWKHTF